MQDFALVNIATLDNLSSQKISLIELHLINCYNLATLDNKALFRSIKNYLQIITKKHNNEKFKIRFVDFINYSGI